jgi:hypothetical protein
MTTAACSINGQTTFLRGFLQGGLSGRMVQATILFCKCLNANRKNLFLRSIGAAGFDLPARPSCLSKQEGQEGGGGVRGPHTPLPIPSFLKTRQEGRRKVRKVGQR